MVDFVLVGTLVILIFSALLQFALALHVRNILIDSAAEGARAGALAGSSAEVGADRARYLIGLALSERYGQDVRTAVVDVDGVPCLQVDIAAPLPLVGLVGPARAPHVSGRAVLEETL